MAGRRDEVRETNVGRGCRRADRREKRDGNGEYGEGAARKRERGRELVGRNCINIVGEGTILYREGVAAREETVTGC